MFCRYCGNQVHDDSVFCSKCGKRLKEAPETQAQAQPQPQPQPRYQPQQPPQPQPQFQPRAQAQPRPRPVPAAGGLPEFLKGHKAAVIAACAVLVVVCGFAVSSMGHSDPPASARPSSGGSSSQKSSSVAVEPAAAEAILVADPGPFFDVEPDEVEEDGDGFRYTYTMALSHTIIDEYLDVLAVHYDLEPSDTRTSASEGQYSFDIPLEMKVEYNHSKSSMVLTLTCGEGVQLEDSGVESSHPGWEDTAIPHSPGSSASSKAPAASSKASSPASSPASSKSSSSGSSKASGGKVSKSSTAVPDLGKFLGVPQSPTETKNYFPYDIDDQKGIKSVDEWRELLTGSYNFKETKHTTDDFTKVASSRGLICDKYYFDYTGGAGIEGKEWPAAGQKADIFLMINYYTQDDCYGISIRLADGLTLEDSGKKASDPPNHKDVTGGGGGSESGGSSGGTNIPEFAKQDCPICKGTKKCQTCGGRGYLYSHASHKYDRNCTDCYNCSGKCRYCNGTGKR